LSVLLLLSLVYFILVSSFFFFNDTATTEIYTLSLHDALPIYVARVAAVNDQQAHLRPPRGVGVVPLHDLVGLEELLRRLRGRAVDRKSTRLNSSHVKISYAVFCLKKKNTIRQTS